MATEIELKLIVDGDEFAHVRAALDALAAADLRQQANYYLDTLQAELHNQRAMLRVRTTDASARITLKLRPKMRDGVLEVSEWERDLPAELAQAWRTAPPPRTSAQALQATDWLGYSGHLAVAIADDAALHTLGAMQNTRRVYAIDLRQLGANTAQTVCIELDHSRYSQGEERFELELEHPQAAAIAPVIHAWLQTLGVHATVAEETKYAQFLRLLARA